MSAICCMCGGAITGKSTKVFFSPIGATNPKAATIRPAHPGCAAILDDDDEEEEGTGWLGDEPLDVPDEDAW